MHDLVEFYPLEADFTHSIQNHAWNKSFCLYMLPPKIQQQWLYSRWDLQESFIIRIEMKRIFFYMI